MTPKQIANEETECHDSESLKHDAYTCFDCGYCPICTEERISKAIKEAVTKETERVYRSFAKEIDASKGPHRTDSRHPITEHCDYLIKLANERADQAKAQVQSRKT